MGPPLHIRGGQSPQVMWTVGLSPGGGGGGGTQSGKEYRMQSDRWRAVAVPTRGISYCKIGGLSESVQLIFHVK